jgi:hypothetical protein
VAPVRGGVTDVGTITIIGGRIYYSRAPAAGDAHANGTIWRANPDGSGEEPITTGSWPRLSPDGRYIAFLRDGFIITYDNKLIVRDLELGTETVVHAAGDYVVGYDWTADSTRILFDWICAMQIVGRDGTNETNFLAFSCYDDAPARHPLDGSWAFHSIDGLYLMSPDGLGRQKIPNTSGGDYWPAWSPDGQWISFGRVYDNAIRNFFKIRPDGSDRTPLTFFDPVGPQTFGPARAWSPDTATLVAPGNVDGVTTLFTIATDGSGTMGTIPLPPGNPPDFVGGVTGNPTPAP